MVLLKESETWDWNKSQSNSGAVLTHELTFDDISDSKEESSSEGYFELTDLENMVYFIGMEILYSMKGIILHQMK